jgi:hypothetical protein
VTLSSVESVPSCSVNLYQVSLYEVSLYEVSLYEVSLYPVNPSDGQTLQPATAGSILRASTGAEIAHIFPRLEQRGWRDLA